MQTDVAEAVDQVYQLAQVVEQRLVRFLELLHSDALVDKIIKHPRLSHFNTPLAFGRPSFNPLLALPCVFHYFIVKMLWDHGNQ